MTVEIIELISLGTSNINHFREDGTEIVDLEQKGEKKWNALLEYINEYTDKHDMEIKQIENNLVWLISS